MDPRRQLGAAGEDAAARWYEAHGYIELERNWRRREGELDLIVERAGVVVICEVKTRSTNAFGSPIEAVTWAKARRIRILAGIWLAENSSRERREIRFDVASVTLRGDKLIVEVIEGAF